MSKRFKTWVGLVVCAAALLTAGLALGQWTTKNRMTKTDQWDIYGSLNIQSAGVLDAMTGGVFQIAGVPVTSTAAELNWTDGIAATAFSLADAGTVHDAIANVALLATSCSGVTQIMYNDGQPGVGTVTLAPGSSVVVDAKIITVGSRIYEVGLDGGTVASGHVAVNVATGSTATATMAAFVTAINADVSRQADAVASQASIMVTSLAVNGGNTLSTNMGGGSVTAAALVNGKAAGTHKLGRLAHTVTATELAMLDGETNNAVALGAVSSTTLPTTVIVQTFTSAGIERAKLTNVTYTWVQANTNHYILKLKNPNSAASGLSANDVVNVIYVQ